MPKTDALTEKTTLVAADKFLIVDSEVETPSTTEATKYVEQANLSAQVQDDLFDNDADTAIASDDIIVKESSGGTKKTVTEAVLSAQIFDDVKSTDGTLADNSDDVVPTEKAVKTYSDTKMALNPTTFAMNGCTAVANAHAEGMNTNASGIASHAEGYNTTASGTASHTECNFTTASGEYSHSEGYGTTANGAASHSGGNYSIARLYAQFARAGGKIAQNGDAQKTEFYLKKSTSDATETELISPTRFVIPEGGIFGCTVSINGSNSDGTVSGFYKRMFVIKNILGTTSLTGTVQTIGTDITTGGIGGISLTADDTNNSLCVKVTGKADTTIYWHCIIEANEVGFY